MTAAPLSLAGPFEASTTRRNRSAGRDAVSGVDLPVARGALIALPAPAALAFLFED